MTKEVEAHIAMANGGSDPLARLAWLRIDGHYAIERILEFDPGKGCWLTLDVSSPGTMHVALYPIVEDRHSPNRVTSPVRHPASPPSDMLRCWCGRH